MKVLRRQGGYVHRGGPREDGTMPVVKVIPHLMLDVGDLVGNGRFRPIILIQAQEEQVEHPVLIDHVPELIPRGRLREASELQLIHHAES